MTAETPVLDTLAGITAASLEHNSLAPRELMLTRIGWHSLPGSADCAMSLTGR
jgi:hypothetical protein